VAFIVDLILANILIYPLLMVAWIAWFPQFFVQFWSQFFQASGQISYPLLQGPLQDQIVLTLISIGGMALYMGGFHAAHGQTPGMALLRVRVVDENGEKPGLGQALSRGLVLSVSSSFYGLPLLYAFFSPNKQALHDLLAKTYVVEA